MIYLPIVYTSEKQLHSTVVLSRRGCSEVRLVDKAAWIERMPDTRNNFLKNFGDGMSLPPVGTGGRPPLPGGVYLGAHQAGGRGTGYGHYLISSNP